MRQVHRSSRLPLAAAGALCALIAAGSGCGGRPFAEGGSREITVLTRLAPDAPEILLFRAILEREAIRIEDEKANSAREMCRHLFDLSLRVVDSTDPAPRLMPEFPKMACLKR